MAYPTPKDLAAIALSALTGAGIPVSFMVSEGGSNALAIAVFATMMILCPSIAGYLSTRSVNAIPHPAAVLVGLIIVVSSVEMDSHPAFWVTNAAPIYCGVAWLAFLTGWATRSLAARRKR